MLTWDTIKTTSGLDDLLSDMVMMRRTCLHRLPIWPPQSDGSKPVMYLLQQFPTCLSFLSSSSFVHVHQRLVGDNWSSKFNDRPRPEFMWVKVRETDGDQLNL